MASHGRRAYYVWARRNDVKLGPEEVEFTITKNPFYPMYALENVEFEDCVDLMQKLNIEPNQSVKAHALIWNAINKGTPNVDELLAKEKLCWSDTHNQRFIKDLRIKCKDATKSYGERIKSKGYLEFRKSRVAMECLIEKTSSGSYVKKRDIQSFAKRLKGYF